MICIHEIRTRCVRLFKNLDNLLMLARSPDVVANFFLRRFLGKVLYNCLILLVFFQSAVGILP